MRRIWALVIVLVVSVIAAGAAWWELDLRWRPHTLTRNQAQIASALQGSGWVSPGISNTKVLWMISYRVCPDCIRFEKEEFPRLHAAGVDTRVIMAPRPRGTTAAERATIAALWAHRSWPLYEQWTAIPVQAWTAPGLPSADSNLAAAAELVRSEQFIDGMRPLLKPNGLPLHYPTLISQT